MLDVYFFVQKEMETCFILQNKTKSIRPVYSIQGCNVPGAADLKGLKDLGFRFLDIFIFFFLIFTIKVQYQLRWILLCDLILWPCHASKYSFNPLNIVVNIVLCFFKLNDTKKTESDVAKR